MNYIVVGGGGVMADGRGGGNSEPMTDSEEFEMANRAFELFTLAERRRALAIIVMLRYPSVEARFFEAVHQVISENRHEEPIDG